MRSFGEARRRYAAADGRFYSLGYGRASSWAAAPAMCCSTQSAVLRPASRRDFRIVERRYVVPWRLFGLRRRGDVILPQARPSRSCRSAISPRGRTDRIVSRRLCQFHQQRVVGPASGLQRAWAMVFPNAGRCRHPASFTKPGLRESCCLRSWRWMIRFGALKRPGLILGSFIAIYGLARIVGGFFREPDPQLGFLWGGLTMGHAAIGADDHCRRDHYCGAWRRTKFEPGA